MERWPVPGEMLQKYIEIRVRLKYRLYFCASRKSLTAPRLMSASELTLQPMYVWAQAGSPSLLRQKRLLLSFVST